VAGLTPPRSGPPLSRKVSAWFVLAIIAAIGLLFFQVIRPFIVAIFVSLVLAVLFNPVHRWLTDRLGGRRRIAAGVTTALVLLLVLMPIGFTLLMAGSQVMETGKDVGRWFEKRSAEDVEETIDDIERTSMGRAIRGYYLQLPREQRDQVKQSAGRLIEGATSAFYRQTRSFLTNAFQFLVNFGIVTLALYYFLADRDAFVEEMHRLMPLDEGEEERMTDQFHRVCRGVVLGTIVAGLVQACLAGIAYAVIGVPQIWILIVFTFLFSFVPVLGAAAVWGLVVVALAIEGRYAAAIGLAVYGTAIISMADNLVRAHVVGTQARLHPLVALVTALGAIQFIGLWGIFVGPMIAALLYPLIYIARHRLTEL